MTININIRKSQPWAQGRFPHRYYLSTWSFCITFKSFSQQSWNLWHCQTDEKLKVKPWVHEQIWTPYHQGAGQLSLTEWYYQPGIKQIRFLKRCKITTTKSDKPGAVGNKFYHRNTSCLIPKAAKKPCQEFPGWKLTFSAVETEVEALTGDLYYEEF